MRRFTIFSGLALALVFASAALTAARSQETSTPSVDVLQQELKTQGASLGEMRIQLSTAVDQVKQLTDLVKQLQAAAPKPTDADVVKKMWLAQRDAFKAGCDAVRGRLTYVGDGKTAPSCAGAR